MPQKQKQQTLYACQQAHYLCSKNVDDGMLWDVCWIGRGHLCHGVDLLVSVAAYVIGRHDVLQG